MKTILFLLLALISCDSRKKEPLIFSLIEDETLIYETHPDVKKIGQIPEINGETTIVEWQGKLVAVTTGLYFTDLATGANIGHYPVVINDIGLISAIVYNNEMFIFGVNKFFLDGRYATQPGNAVTMIRSTDLVNWSSPIEVLQAPENIRLLNSSVDRDATGFVMVLEFNSIQEYGTYHNLFARSSDLLSWNYAGGILNPNTYSACPSIRYMPDGYYYVIHLEQHARNQAAFVSRSKDLISWEHQKGTYVVVSPKNAPGFEWKTPANSFTPGPSIPPNNNSDVDVVEFQGKTYVGYNFGDQATFGGQAYAVYDGDMLSFFHLFF